MEKDMPVLKLTQTHKRRMIEAKRQCPCLKQSTLAMIFGVSPARVGEILRDHKRKTEAIDEVLRKHRSNN
jgi:hypothetical protein